MIIPGSVGCGVQPEVAAGSWRQETDCTCLGEGEIPSNISSSTLQSLDH